MSQGKVDPQAAINRGNELRRKAQMLVEADAIEQKMMDSTLSKYVTDANF